MRVVTKQVAHEKKKMNHKNAKVLLRAKNFIIFFVLIFSQIDCIEYRLGYEELTALKESRLKDPDIDKTKGSTNLFT